MASSPLLVSRNCSHSNLCHAAKPDGHRLMHSQLVSILQQTSMKRSISAPCLAPASRFGTSHSGFEEHQACLLASRKSEMQEQTQQSTQADVERQQFQSHASSSIHSIKTPNFATDGRFASLSRVLLVSQPQNMFRSLANRKWPSAVGPISLLVFLFGTLLALLAAVRGALVRKVKSCKCCKGFGVVRCRLCDGRGSVDWRAKFSYSEQCPLCVAKRFVVCPDCGGHHHRRLFNHAKAGGNGSDGYDGLATARD